MHCVACVSRGHSTRTIRTRRSDAHVVPRGGPAGVNQFSARPIPPHIFAAESFRVELYQDAAIYAGMHPTTPTPIERVRNARQRLADLLRLRSPHAGEHLPDATLHLTANCLHAIADIVQERIKLDSKQPKQGTTPMGPHIPPQ